MSSRLPIVVHPKFLRLVCELGEPAPHVHGHLEHLWQVAYARPCDPLGDGRDVEIAAAWDGEPGRFADALFRVGFLDDLSEGATPSYRIHDLKDHAPEYVRKRMKREAARRERGVTISELQRRADLASWERKHAGGERSPDAHGGRMDADGGQDQK